MKITAAGESHGKGLIAIVEGLPEGLEIDLSKIDEELVRRSAPFGRGGRQAIEHDRVEILSGIFGGKTTSSPLTLMIKNSDYENWAKVFSGQEERPLNCPRPGHADLAGMIKYKTSDARFISERASARSTAIKVAVGALCRQYLEALGIFVTGFVRSIGCVEDEKEYSFEQIKGRGELGFLDPALEGKAHALIEKTREEGDTLGGTVEIRAKGLKAGFGSCMTDEEKLDARIAFSFLGVQAVKGVEFGAGFALGKLKGSEAQDEISLREGKIVRESNRAGGIEGGMTNGEEIIVRAVMKPIPSLKRGLRSVNMQTCEPTLGSTERADVCAVPSCEVILESVLCTTLLQAVLERLGGDRLQDVKERYEKL